MRRILLLPVLLFALTLSACGPGSKLGNLIATVTTTITNPVTATDIYRLKAAYAATLQVAVDYRTHCYAKPYAQLIADPVDKVLCQSRRAVVRAIQSAQAKAASAVMSAQTFAVNNPTLDATTAISAAWDAVTAFQAAVPKS